MDGPSRTSASLIYLDGFATTPLAPEARLAMMQAWDLAGNASSPHRAGACAAAVVAQARSAVADLIGAAPPEIVFTSGATEANNLALIGAARRVRREASARNRVVVSAIEHKAVLEPAKALEREGFELVIAPVDRHGVVSLPALEQLVDERTLIVSLMAANNETAVLQPVAEVAKIAHASGALMHSDAAQAVGKVMINVLELDVDYLSISSHKLYGPMGVGALFMSATSPRPEPLQHGGGQEQGVRAGTEPVALLAGFGAAAKLMRRSLHDEAARSAALAQRILQGLRDRQVRFSLISDGVPTLSGAFSLMLHDAEAEDVVQKLSSHICLSTGSACSAGQVVSSHVLRAMSFSEAEAKHVLRIFCGRYNTEAEIDIAAQGIAVAVRESALAAGDLRQ